MTPMVDHVFVTLEQDDSGYPPWDEEAIPAVSGPDEHSFVLTASPTFVRGLSLGDVVHGVPVGDRWYIDDVIEWRGHSTVRVILFKDEHHDTLLAYGSKHHVTISHTPIQGLFSIDIPPESSFTALKRELVAGSKQGWWDYDEGAVAANHE
jgi:hypothetical protein